MERLGIIRHRGEVPAMVEDVVVDIAAAVAREV
jgi:hypothetical protein